MSFRRNLAIAGILTLDAIVAAACGRDSINSTQIPKEEITPTAVVEKAPHDLSPEAYRLTPTPYPTLIPTETPTPAPIPGYDNASILEYIFERARPSNTRVHPLPQGYDPISGKTWLTTPVMPGNSLLWLHLDNNNVVLDTDNEKFIDLNADGKAEQSITKDGKVLTRADDPELDKRYGMLLRLFTPDIPNEALPEYPSYINDFIAQAKGYFKNVKIVFNGAYSQDPESLKEFYDIHHSTFFQKQNISQNVIAPLPVEVTFTLERALERIHYPLNNLESLTIHVKPPNKNVSSDWDYSGGHADAFDSSVIIFIDDNLDLSAPAIEHRQLGLETRADRLSHIVLHEWGHMLSFEILQHSVNPDDYLVIVKKGNGYVIQKDNPLYVAFAKLEGWQLLSEEEAKESFFVQAYVRKEKDARMVYHATQTSIEEDFAEKLALHLENSPVLRPEERKFFQRLLGGYGADPVGFSKLIAENPFILLADQNEPKISLHQQLNPHMYSNGSGTLRPRYSPKKLPL